MKKIFILFLIFGLNSISLGEESLGCGMGWKVTKSYTTSAASTRSSTNATFSSTFGMTSGTSGCAKHDLVMKDKMDLHFIEGNYDFVVENAAMGSGEYLIGLARVLGCEDSITDYFSKEAQNNFDTLFIQHNNYYNSLKQIKKMIRQNKRLSSQCHLNS